jgi:porphobilinogen deaminase
VNHARPRGLGDARVEASPHAGERERREAARGGLEVEVRIIRRPASTTRRCALRHRPARRLYPQLDEALLSGEIDLAVHSRKDVPTRFPRASTLAAITERRDPSTSSSPGGGATCRVCRRAVVATSSLRAAPNCSTAART